MMALMMLVPGLARAGEDAFGGADWIPPAGFEKWRAGPGFWDRRPTEFADPDDTITYFCTPRIARDAVQDELFTVGATP